MDADTCEGRPLSRREACAMRKVAAVMRLCASVLPDRSEIRPLFARWATRLSLAAELRDPTRAGDPRALTRLR